MKNAKITIAGSGGQGILFAGKVITYVGMYNEKEVSWMPTYGPEMRGGTATCHIIISDEEIGLPIIAKPSILIAMNKLSVNRYEAQVDSGGYLIRGNFIHEDKIARTDIHQICIPALEISRNANMVFVGMVCKLLGVTNFDTIKQAIKQSLSLDNQHLNEPNYQAFKQGYDYEN